MVPIVHHLILCQALLAQTEQQTLELVTYTCWYVLARVLLLTWRFVILLLEVIIQQHSMP